MSQTKGSVTPTWMAVSAIGTEDGLHASINVGLYEWALWYIHLV